MCKIMFFFMLNSNFNVFLNLLQCCLFSTMRHLWSRYKTYIAKEKNV